jgi:hypothetical protein
MEMVWPPVAKVAGREVLVEGCARPVLQHEYAGVRGVVAVRAQVAQLA